MDPLRAERIARAMATPPEEKSRQVLELMSLGIRMQRQKLERAHPDADQATIDELLFQWMLRDD